VIDMLKKIGKKISFLNRIGNFISTYTRCVYKSTIAPHFEYYATLVVNMAETQFSTLQKAHKRAMRVALHCDKHTKIDHMLQALQFMSINYITAYAFLSIRYQTICCQYH